MIELPLKKIKAELVNPQRIILFGNPKVGKTTALAALPKCLIIDVESGSGYVDALKINVLAIAKEENKTPLTVLKSVIKKIKEANKANGGYVYKYGAIDTITALEDLLLPLAKQLYVNTPQGKNYTGNDVTELANGSGYRYTREAMKIVLNELDEIFETLIILGHVKDKLVSNAGEEMNERGLDLTGKLASIVASKADAIGYIYREYNETIVNFTADNSLVCGGRCKHLINKKVKLIESDDDNNITVDWSEIFID